MKENYIRLLPFLIWVSVSGLVLAVKYAKVSKFCTIRILSPGPHENAIRLLCFPAFKDGGVLSQKMCIVLF